MPRQQGYGQQGYGNSYGRSRQHAQVTGQYESAFNPIPIEFLQEQLRGRQQNYDQAFAGTIQAKEQMAAQQAALQDIGAKNQIIGDTMGNIDKVVEEKYGGDWSRASKEIATMVSSARQNPFWETTKHLQEQQKIQQDFQLKNPNAWIYNDVNKQSSIDPRTGQVRSAEDLTFRGGQRGDYAGSIEQQFGDVQANIDSVLKKATEAEGMLSNERIEEITNTRLEEFADAGLETFLTNNPDYMQGHMSQGMTEEQVRAKAKNDIMGQIGDKAFKAKTQQVMQDKGYWEAYQARAAAGSAADGYVVRNAGEFIDMSINDPKKAATMMRNTKAQIDKLPEGSQKDQLMAQYESDIEAREFLMDTVKESQYAPDVQKYYDKHVKWAEKNDVDPGSFEEFEDVVYDAVREGKTADVIKGESKYQLPYGGGTIDSNYAFRASNDFNTGMKKFVKNEGKAAINVNIIGGETGTKAKDTDIGRLNDVLTDEWNESTSSFTLPYSNRQIGDVLENEKKYKNRDADKDIVKMTDGFMNGKPTYQLNVYDKDGNKLGAEYINPTHTGSASGNIMKVARKMISSTDPTKREIGKTMAMNAIYSPAIQGADIRNNPKGMLQGVAHEGNPVGYEKDPGTDGYKMYVKLPDGTKDYFEIEDDNNKKVIFMPKNEADMKQGLMALQFPNL